MLTSKALITIPSVGLTGTRKLVQSSVRRPGNATANRFPSCTPAQAKKFDDLWVPLPGLRKFIGGDKA